MWTSAPKAHPETRTETTEPKASRHTRVLFFYAGIPAICVMCRWMLPSSPRPDGIHMGYALSHDPDKDKVICPCGWNHRYLANDHLIQSYQPDPGGVPHV